MLALQIPLFDASVSRSEQNGFATYALNFCKIQDWPSSEKQQRKVTKISVF